MLILGIESSCDDTSVCLLEAGDTGHTILSLKTASQIDIHKQYGGVVPEVAGRLHAEAIAPLIEEVLNGQPKPEVVAVTSGPGLITSLLVGVEAARTLSYAWDIPLVSMNHLDGHIHSVELAAMGKKSENLIQFPAIALIVSGGHTELVLLKDHGDYQLLGATKDDAAGECFDKVAKLLDLPYPGGPQISKLAATGRTSAIPFPRPMIDEKNYDFSFSGLKTSALYWLRDHSLSALNVLPNQPAGIFGITQSEPTINDFAASVEQAIVDVLVAKTLKAAKQFKPQQILLVGGVAANKKLRLSLGTQLAGLYAAPQLLIPNLPFCMDNGAMIAAAAYYQAKQKKFTPWDKLDANSNWKIA